MKTIDTTGIEQIDRDECVRLLTSGEVGRFGFVSGGMPEILPVNYTMDGDAVVFATATGTKLWGATRGPVVFEIDGIDPTTRSGWSVVVHGLAMEVTDLEAPALIERVRALAPNPWAGGDRPHLVRIAPRTITGRRVGS
ncbi:MAG TPA: pyridoxamine 5'-phosphate oxidase family protein [Acidimicrobiales bacterium]|nr:pyridoxamine 5'-phosphate oxidase family protein [Acidimicrobiales bacterium]